MRRIEMATKSPNSTDPPTDSSDAPKEDDQGWGGIIRSIQSPLSMFALVVLVCNSVFAIGAAKLGLIEAFTYSIHLFLGIVGSFTLIALWYPRVLYHPKDVEKYGMILKEKKYANIVITIVLISILGVYTLRENDKLEQKQATVQLLAKELGKTLSTGQALRFVCEPNLQNKGQVNILDCKLMVK